MNLQYELDFNLILNVRIEDMAQNTTRRLRCRHSWRGFNYYRRHVAIPTAFNTDQPVTAGKK